MPISRLTLEKYPNTTFIETGSGAGDGIQTAIDAGFRRVISIESSERQAIMCQCRFEDDARVRVVHGDSGAMLREVLGRVGEPATIWLHTPSPMPELDAIAHHQVAGHAILIDGAKQWKRETHGFGLQELIAKIREIDERYRFWFEPSGDKADGILVARFI